MLNLTPPQQQCLANTHPGMVVLRGTAGSGKTTVGLYRAIARASLGRRVLLLTYAKSLVEALVSLVHELEGDIPANLSIITVDSCLWQTVQHLLGQPLAPMDEDRKRLERCMRAAIDQTTDAHELSGRDGGHFLQEEIESVIWARGLTTWEAYRDAPRIGRGSPLGRVQRRAVWDVALAYQQQRQRANLTDQHTVALTLLQHPTALPADLCYDDIIIDETQDVTLAKLQAVARLLRPQTEQQPGAAPTYWLLTDAAQTIYTSSLWWQENDLGHDIHRLFLRRNHRNTRQIADAASALLTHNTLRTRDVPLMQPQRTTRTGPQPTIVTCDSIEDQAQWVRARIQDLCNGTDMRFSDFAIVCRTHEICNQAAAALNGAHIRHTNGTDLLENSVKVLTYHSAKGLEFPVVFVVGANFGKVPNYATLQGRTEESLARETERERALFYVALTRAADMLYILTDLGKESPFLAELGDDVGHTVSEAVRDRQGAVWPKAG